MKRCCSVLLLCCAIGCARGNHRAAEQLVESAAPAITSPTTATRDWSTRAAPVPGLAADEFKQALERVGDEYATEGPTIKDPYKSFNKAMFHFNNALHLHVMRPISVGYKYLLYPRFVRKGIRSFIINLGFPGRFLNLLLQGRGRPAGEELGRFLVNTTVGVLGFWDPASKLLHLGKYEEDFDQTLGVWGLATGPYLTWPAVGPSSIRGTFGWLGDGVLNPIVSMSIVRAVNWINDISLDPDTYKQYLESAVDPYSGVRNAYIQSREQEIRR